MTPFFKFKRFIVTYNMLIHMLIGFRSLSLTFITLITAFAQPKRPKGL